MKRQIKAQHIEGGATQKASAEFEVFEDFVDIYCKSADIEIMIPNSEFAILCNEFLNEYEGRKNGRKRMVFHF